MKVVIFPFTTAMCGVCGGHMSASTSVRVGQSDPHILMWCFTENCPQQNQRIKVRGLEVEQDAPKGKRKRAK